jgi:hypothetical protein
MNISSSSATAAAPLVTSAREAVPVTWSGQDEVFFRMLREVFPAPYLRGATALLASYDPEPDYA